MLDFDLTDEQRALQRRVRDFTDRHVTPGYLERSASDAYPENMLTVLADEGLLGLRYPMSVGGAGLDEVSIGIVLEELAKGDMNVALLVFFLAGWANEGLPRDLAETVTKGVIRGQTMVAAGITEPQGGSDVAALRTRAEIDGDEYVISGEKTSVGLAYWARYATVLCRLGGEGYEGVGTIFVDLDQPGVERRRIRDMGSGIVGRGSLRFTAARAPRSWLLADAGEGFRQTMRRFDVARALVSIMALGTAEASLTDAIDYARTRSVFGKRIGDYQGVAFRLVEDLTLIEAMRQLIFRTLWQADQGREHTVESSMCKWWVPVTAQDICHRSLLTFGHYGYSNDNPVQQRYRDIVGVEIGDGTAEIQKLIIARRILGKDFRPG